MDRVVGTYAGGKPIRVLAIVRRQGNQLLVYAPELGPETPLVFAAKTELVTVDAGDRFSIRTDKSGAVTSLEWGGVVLSRQSASRP